jgi:5S rRNA maturation endonuclease (ribonuclease M5)
MYSGSGFLRGRIVIPVHNEHAELVAYVGRSVNDQPPKYRLPAGFKKSDVLFNLHRAIRAEDRSVLVVEGFFDALKVHQAGHPSVVALMGSTLSVRQAELLAIHFENALIMLDGDPAGRSGTEAIADRLRDVSMNTLKPDAHGRTKSDIHAIRHVYLDLDDGGQDKLDALLARTDVPPPNWVLQSSPGMAVSVMSDLT